MATRVVILRLTMRVKELGFGVFSCESLKTGEEVQSWNYGSAIVAAGRAAANDSEEEKSE